MGGKPIRSRQHIHLCFAVLIFLSGCSVFDDFHRQQELREALASGGQMLMQGDFEGSLKTFESVAAIAHDEPPADLAVYNIGLVYAHPQNPKKDRLKAIGSFRQVAALYPNSPWAGQAKIWVSVLSEAEQTQQEVERSKEIVELVKQEAERSREALEKSKQEVEKSRQEIERTKQIIEKSRQVDIEIEEKRRVRGR